MSRRTQRTQRSTQNRTAHANEDSSEEEAPRRRRAHTQADPNQTISATQNTTIIRDTVKLIIQYGVSGMPFKRSDLVKNALGGNQKLYSQVFSKARDILNTVYGMSVNEVANAKGSTHYFLSNHHPVYNDLEYRRNQKRESTLLFLVLSYIFMKGGQVTDTTLKNFLEKVNINCDGNDPSFGNVHNLVFEKFVKQHYLTIGTVVVEGSHDEKTSLEWGQRAEKEFEKKNVIQTVAKLMKTPPVTFIAQYQEVYGEISMEQVEELMRTQSENISEADADDTEDTPMEVDQSGEIDDSDDSD